MGTLLIDSKLMLFGSLGKGRGASGDRSRTLALQGPIPLVDLLNQLDLKPDQIQMAMVNHRAVAPDYVVQPGDRLALFPKEYPLFADWMTYRSR